MASAIRLYCGPQPANHLRLASGSIGAAWRPSRVHLSPCQPHHFLSNCSKNCQVVRPVRRVNCILENSSLDSKTDDETENNIVRGMTGISVVLACVLGVFSFKGLMNSKSATAYAWTLKRAPSSHEHAETPSPVHIGGEIALDSLVKMIKYVPPPPSDNLTTPQIPKQPSKEEIDNLKLYALGLSKSGKQPEAIKLLEKAHKRCKDQSEAEHFLSVALAELHIFQGNYREAKKRLDRLIDGVIESEDPGRSKRKLSEMNKISMLLDDPFLLSRAEIFLYKAIVHTMLEDKEAAKWGEAFRQTLG